MLLQLAMLMMLLPEMGRQIYMIIMRGWSLQGTRREEGGLVSIDRKVGTSRTRLVVLKGTSLRRKVRTPESLRMRLRIILIIKIRIGWNLLSGNYKGFRFCVNSSRVIGTNDVSCYYRSRTLRILKTEIIFRNVTWAIKQKSNLIDQLIYLDCDCIFLWIDWYLCL